MSRRVIRATLEAGINVFDSADIYGIGNAEILLGEVLADVQQIVVMTKVGILPSLAPDGNPARDFSPKHILASAEASLRRLRRNQIDVYYLHGPEIRAITDDVWEALLQLKSRGMVRYLGVSLRTSHLRDSMIALWLSTPAEVFQIEYGIHDPVSAARIDSIDFKNKGVIARSVLAHGMIRLHNGRNNPFSAEDHRHSKWVPEHADKALRLSHALSNRAGRPVELAAAALIFASESPSVAVTLIGAHQPSHVQYLGTLSKCGGLSRDIILEEALRVQGDMTNGKL